MTGTFPSVCFLPFCGEFGWYLFVHVKRIEEFCRKNPWIETIACIKPGHECLFPDVDYFFYDWKDISDNQKIGINLVENEENLKQKINKHFSFKTITFNSPSEMNWEDKEKFAPYTFKPLSINPITPEKRADIVITPRYREVDVLRNIPKEYWQKVVDGLVANGLTVAACGSKEASYDLENVKFKSWEGIDIDDDVNCMNHAKIVLTQETGLAYLAYMCERPIAFIGNYMGDLGADLHRNPKIPFFHISPNVENLEKCIEDSINIIVDFCNDK